MSYLPVIIPEVFILMLCILISGIVYYTDKNCHNFPLKFKWSARYSCRSFKLQYSVLHLYCGNRLREMY